MKIKIKRIPGFEYFPLILVLILIVCNSLSTISYYNSSEFLKDSIKESMEVRTKENAILISRSIKELKTIIEGVAYIDSIKTMDWDIQLPILLREVNRLKVDNFQVINTNGVIQSTTGSALEISESKWVKDSFNGTTCISQPFLDKNQNKTIFICSTPIKDNEGKIMGVLAATIDPKSLYDFISNIKVSDTGYAYIFDNEGTIIAHPDYKDIFDVKKGNENKRYPNSLIKDIFQKNQCYSEFLYNGEKKCATYALIPDTDWVLALTSTKSEIYKEANNLWNKFLIQTHIIIAICFILCIFIIAYIFKKRVIHGLEKRVEEDTRLLNECAELEKIRTQFFANVSHEFRTPLNVILSSIQLCNLYLAKQKTPYSNNVDKHLKVMKQNCYRLLRLVNNLIDTTRIDVGFLDRHLKNHDIVKVIEDITMSVTEFTELKGIKMSFYTDVKKKVIACDEDKIERIMLNLISNAVKFTDPGGTISVTVRDNEGNINICVKDTGIGIPEEKRKSIFERFVQVEETLTRNYEGSGIGLSMVKAFVEMHDGYITVNSECGKGSEFIINLPVNIIKEENEEVVSKDMINQQRIERIRIEFSDIYCCN